MHIIHCLKHQQKNCPIMQPGLKIKEEEILSIHVGLVRQIKETGLAEVQTDRQNACGGCQSSDGCRACLSGGGKLLKKQSCCG